MSSSYYPGRRPVAGTGKCRARLGGAAQGSCALDPAFRRRSRCGTCGAVRTCIFHRTPFAEAADFTLTVLNSNRCLHCDNRGLPAFDDGLFPQEPLRTVSCEHEEGEKLVTQYGVTMFPTYILSNAFSSSPRFPRLRRMVDQERGDFVVSSRISQNSVWFLCPRPRLAVLLDNRLVVRGVSPLKAAEIWRESGLN